jgi:hypothetical protein
LKESVHRGESSQASMLGKRTSPSAFEVDNQEGAKNTFKRSASDGFIGQNHSQGF